MPYVYILKSESPDRYYIGSTIDLNDRMKHHAGGHTPTTKRYRGFIIVLAQEYSTLQEARQIEKRLKKLKRRDYIKKIVSEGHINIGL